MDTVISYRIVRSARKTAAIHITPEGEVILRCPKFMTNKEAQALIREKSGWIQVHLEKIQTQPNAEPFTQDQLNALAAQAKEEIPPRVLHFARQMGVDYGRITIRCQHTRWGSCSSAGNLSFNCLLMRVPPEVRDYVIVHELSHRKEMNHSSAFWALVEQTIPDYKTRLHWLKTEGSALIRRLPK